MKKGPDIKLNMNITTPTNNYKLIHIIKQNMNIQRQSK